MSGPSADPDVVWPTQPNPLGALSIVGAVAGSLIACIPGATVAGLATVAVALVLAVISLCLRRRTRWAGITGSLVSVVGVSLAFYLLSAVPAYSGGESIEGTDVETSRPVADAAVSEPPTGEQLVPDPPVDDAPAPDPAPVAPQFSARGNTLLGFGDSFSDRGATMVINGATFGAECTSSTSGGSYSQTPANGQFLVLDVSGSTSNDATINPFNSLGWSWVDSNGQAMTGSLVSPQARLCFSADQMMPDLSPGQSGSGRIVLDVSSLGGTLIYRSPFEESGYEWTITVP